MSKRIASKRTKIALTLLVIVVAVGGVWLLSGPMLGGPKTESTLSDKIEIVSFVLRFQHPLGKAPFATDSVVTVRNVGSGTVEITTIYIGGVPYGYSSSDAPGKFSAASNKIAPGESVTFTVTIGSGGWASQAWGVRVVTKNGTEASSSCNC